MFSREEFGKRLREVRKARGGTQASVGAVLGGTATLISDLEKGRRTTTLEKLTELAQ